MKNTIKKLTARLLAVFAVFATAGLFNVAAASAWGPERPTFTMENPASYPVFNSITNNPTIGDERDFVRVGQIDADVTELGNEVEVIPGKQYLVYVYFHNNASATYNDSAHGNVGVALRTRMSSSFSKVLTPSERATITATVTADNSNPVSVWDEAYMTTTYDKVFLRYVSGSAKIYNDWGTNGSVMPSSLFTESGTLLGLNELNGVIPGCEEYHGVVTYVLQAEELSGTVEKEVSRDNADYYNSVETAPGDEIYFRLTIRNAGDVALTNATIADALPSGLELVPGSVQLSANDSGVWDTLSDNIIGSGYNLGTIGTGNTIYIIYRAKVVENLDCGSKDLNNVATLTYDSENSTGDTDNASAKITVKKDDCVTPTPEDCNTNPNLPGCDLPKEIVQTGPLEIVMAAVVILGIGAGGFYLWRTRRTLKTVENVVSGDNGSVSTVAPTDPEVSNGSAISNGSAADQMDTSVPTDTTVSNGIEVNQMESAHPTETATNGTTPSEPVSNQPVAPASFSEPTTPANPTNSSEPKQGE